MQSLSLGADGPAVSALCLGAMRFGTTTDRDTSFAILDRYVDAGGGFIDTANVYAGWLADSHGGESERLLAEWFKERGNRDEIFLATKLGSRLQESGRGLTAAMIEKEFAGSLERLGVDHVDLLYAHFDDPSGTPVAETMGAFGKLIDAGKVRCIGASNYLAWRLEETRLAAAGLGVPSWCCFQARHSYLRCDPWATYGAQEPGTPEVLRWCADHDVRVTAYSPLLGGCYSGRPDRPIPRQYDTPRNRKRLGILQTLADDKGVPAVQLVYAWMLRSDPAVIPIAGCSSVAQLDEAINAMAIELSAEEMELLDGAGWVDG